MASIDNKNHGTKKITKFYSYYFTISFVIIIGFVFACDSIFVFEHLPPLKKESFIHWTQSGQGGLFLIVTTITSLGILYSFICYTLDEDVKIFDTKLLRQRQRVQQKHARTLRHRMRNHVTPIVDKVNLLKSAIESRDCLRSQDVIGRVSGITTSEIISQIREDMNVMLNDIKGINTFDEYLETDTINLSSFIREYCETHKDTSFNYDLTEVQESREKGNIIFNADAMRLIFDNVINNAVEHGFFNRNNNIIKFVLKEDKRKIYLDICNNGHSISSQEIIENSFNLSNGTSSNDKKSHSGQGLHDIEDIMSMLDGLFDLVCDESDFPVKYRFVFANDYRNFFTKLFLVKPESDLSD